MSDDRSPAWTGDWVNRDAIVRITSTAICGSDLHLYDGYIPTMEEGDVLGHEFMGEVVEVGGDVKTLKSGDRVVVAFPISCGHCFFCEHEKFSLCENSNPNAWIAEKLLGHSPAAAAARFQCRASTAASATSSRWAP